MNRSSSNAGKEPYTRPMFYSQPENQFWLKSNCSQATKDRLNALVKLWEDENRNISTFE